MIIKKLGIGLLWTLLTVKVLGSGNVKEEILTLTNLDERSHFALHIDKDNEERAVGLAVYDPSDNTWSEFDISKLNRGVAVKEEGRYKVIILKSKDFENDRGGHFIIDYLRNGITGSRASFPVKVDFDGHRWGVFHRGRAIRGLKFKLNKIFGKTVGIKEVQAK